MKESIYTIPISEAFEAMNGCPVCDLRNRQESRWLDYITGGAMMEPDVRVETNRLGFCRRHYGLMLGLPNTRLPVALMISTRLGCALAEFQKSGELSGKTLDISAGSCFVCDRTDSELRRICENIAVIWAREESFQKLYMQQKHVCINDAFNLIEAGKHVLHGKARRGFIEATKELAKKHAVSLKTDIDAFCALFDYRAAHNPSPPEEVSTAIDRAISWLSVK